MLEKVKKALRVNGTTFDDEIADLISAAKLDLKISDVNNSNESDALVAQAITLYCKSMFGMSNPDSEKYWESYVALKTHLSLSGGYHELESHD